MTTTVVDVPGSVGAAIYDLYRDEDTTGLKAADIYAIGFYDAAEWFAAGMAVCAFLEDLARLRASPPPVSSDGVKNILNQIEAFSTAMRRTWGEP